MGIVNIEDELHEQLRKASKASYRSINAQAAFWIRVGMLCELNPGLTFQEIVIRELREAGVDPGGIEPAEPHALGTAAK
ncbi:ParD-like family protein [Novosphingobium sp. BL-8H]|uniref:ParD-like family protein n=1 Tax=Novosphingobium sp. BL-8H TaxID=3127640 RepID=UPI003756E87B